MNLIVSARRRAVALPDGNWWIFVLWVMPPLIAIAVALILSISARVSSAAAAQQASSLATLPRS